MSDINKSALLEWLTTESNDKNWSSEARSGIGYVIKMVNTGKLDVQVSSLITTIESKKEEIEKIEEERDQALKDYESACTMSSENSRAAIKLSDEVESLKAITELSVKGLEEVFKACKKRTFNDCGDLRAVVYDTSQAALEEIERLQHE